MSRNALNYCVKCRGLIHRDPLTCGAACGRVSHAKCSGLSEQQLQIIQITPNINWQCDFCLRQLFSVKLELCLKQHEKRLEILERGLATSKCGKVNESCKEPVLCPFLPSSITMKAVFITAAFALFTVGLLVVLATTTNIFSKSLSKNPWRVLSVAEWGGRKPKSELTKLVLPVHRVIISHTAAEGCETRDVCESRVQIVQNFHMDGWNWDHIGYNFLVGGDGLVYEGRGWDVQGAHTKGYNTDSIGISFIGTFVKIRPSDAQLYACQKLLEEGVRLKKLAPDYKLYGHRQLSATESPGDVLYRIIQTWPHWTNKKPT
ncbi:peptidoglycan-recognition protein SC2 isoform X8 [Drosophila mojavensis]|uniref:peptidoglycan-recognition protein SC2 isoform X8 n=1 Tax=Drosophila mojavensis TaxID=7230 RepID=UPI001CD192D7|nr:peptidoglycan-recognition protein SC2 isoform X8 [Drosophila mojavensis]